MDEALLIAKQAARRVMRRRGWPRCMDHEDLAAIAILRWVESLAGERAAVPEGIDEQHSEIMLRRKFEWWIVDAIRNEFTLVTSLDDDPEEFHVFEPVSSTNLERAAQVMQAIALLDRPRHAKIKRCVELAAEGLKGFEIAEQMGVQGTTISAYMNQAREIMSAAL